MRTALDLLESPDGRAMLADRGVLHDPEAFRARLRPPQRSGLADALGRSPDDLLVYVGQQSQPDYTRSVVAKISAAAGLARCGVTPVALWLDTDRTGSTPSTVVLSAPGREPLRSRLVPSRWREVEIRFAPLDRARVAAVLEEVAAWVRSGLPADDPAHEGVEGRLRALLDGVVASLPDPCTLAEADGALADALVRALVPVEVPSLSVSSVLGRGVVDETLDRLLTEHARYVAAHNAAVEELHALDVDPQVHLLADDHLPLFWSCPRDGLRRRLSLVREGADAYATTTCRCGDEPRFHLGTRELSAAEITATGRWSVDVTLPVHVDALVSGGVVGKSSALYGLVLNRVVEDVLEREPVPLLVPLALADALRASAEPDSLLVDTLLTPPADVPHGAAASAAPGVVTLPGQRTSRVPA